MNSQVRFGPSMITFLVLLVFGFVGSHIEGSVNRSGPICTGQGSAYDGFDEASVNIALQVNEHLISVAYLLAGGAAFLIFKFIEKKISLSAGAGAFIVIAFSLVMFSLYWAQVYQVRVLEMLSGKCVLLTSGALHWPSLLQYYCLFFAAIAVAFALFLALPEFDAEKQQ